jgi:hypothetical protein
MTGPSRVFRLILLAVPVAAILLVAAGAVYLYFWPDVVEARLRNSLTAALEDRFQSKVALEKLQIKLFPGLRVEGHHLSLRHQGRNDVPPLIQVETFSFSAGLLALFTPAKHIPLVRVQNLQISIPPRDSGGNKPPEPRAPLPEQLSRIVVDRIICEHADVLMLPRETGKVPLDWEIHHLALTAASASQPFTFYGELTNGKPAGEIATNGTFGPWNAEDPGNTPVSGQYAFTDANLTPLPGIGGILSSTGKYSGLLSELEVQGVTDTPDFSLDAAGTPVPLHTEFSATVDGTNGDTQLHPVKAQLADSLIIAEGSVVRVPSAQGHLISIEATVSDGRIQDFLKLATRSEKPILTGPVKIKAKVVIPPGKERAIEKLSLDGKFAVEGGNWGSVTLRERLQLLSRHALGKPQDEEAGSAVSDLSGDFFVKKGVLHFRRLSFKIEGATVDLNGTYTLQQGELDLSGHLQLQAKLSQTVTGAKSLLLKPLDPFFAKKGGGAVLPIHISGTRENPVFGVSVFHKSFEKPLHANGDKAR